MTTAPWPTPAVHADCERCGTARFCEQGPNCDVDANDAWCRFCHLYVQIMEKSA